MGKILILDTETCGLTPHKDYGHTQVIELSTIEAHHDLPSFLEEVKLDVHELITYYQETAYRERFIPSMPIDPRATEVHGIRFKDLIGCRKSEHIELPNTKYIIAHNAPFDVRALNVKDRPYICTMGLAKVLDKQLKLNFPSHKLDSLIVHFYSEGEARLVIKETHDALFDTIKVVMLLKKLIEFIPAINSWEELYNFQTILKGKKK